MPDVIKDYDKIVYDTRIAILGGEKIDVTVIPSRIAMEVAIFKDRAILVKGEDSFKDLIRIVAKVCRLTNENITDEWLLDNTHIEELNDFLTFVLTPINKSVNDKDKGKNKKKV